MRFRRWTLLVAGLGWWLSASCATTSATTSAGPPVASPDQSSRSTRIRVVLPDDAADLTVDGKAMTGSGETRSIDLPLTAGTPSAHTFVTVWRPNTYTEMTRTKTVTLRAGESATVDLSRDDPTDRVKVIYVPTPADVADEMAKLAGISAKDVVFEPGCGDARITIAAVRAGAQRGVGIDIDPERVAEARANVKAAGLADRIEIRLGDALDIKDLSSATVVMLYMGDHFNLLIRPALWRDLPVGARVVSHRFLMGDWQPDKSTTMTSDFGAEYELHVWTITPEIKRRAKGSTATIDERR